MGRISMVNMKNMLRKAVVSKNVFFKKVNLYDIDVVVISFKNRYTKESDRNNGFYIGKFDLIS